MYHLSHFQGTPYEVGHTIGVKLGHTYLDSLDGLLRAIDPDSEAHADVLARAAGRWFATLPPRYQAEFRGMAAAIGCRVEDLLLTYVAENGTGACTSLIVEHDGVPWLGRNNDYYHGPAWNHITVRDIPGRLSTMLFGLPGDVF